jgi:DNA replication protein DnaC
MERLPASRLKGVPVRDDVIGMVYKEFPDLPKSHEYGCLTCQKNRGVGRDGVIFWRGQEWECDCQDQLQRAKHYLSAGIGDMYQRIHYEDWARGERALDAVGVYRDRHNDFISSGFGIVAYGGFGTGKTMLLVLLLKDLIRDFGYDAYYTTFGDLMSMFTDGWHDRSAREDYRMRISRSRILMIDDVGRGFVDNRIASAEMDNILRSRVQQSRPTFITMNLELDEFQDVYGGAAMSLLTERSVELRLEGESYRTTMNEKVMAEIGAGERRPIF